MGSAVNFFVGKPDTIRNFRTNPKMAKRYDPDFFGWAHRLSRHSWRWESYNYGLNKWQKGKAGTLAAARVAAYNWWKNASVDEFRRQMNEKHRLL